MKIERECRKQTLNWSLLPDLEVKLERLGFGPRTADSSSVNLQRFPDSFTVDSTEAAYQNIQEFGTPMSFSVWLYRTKDNEDVTVYIGDSGLGGIKVYIDGKPVRVDLLDTVVQFLGLQPAEPKTTDKALPRTAFIAHRFDEIGGAMAGKLARFLEFLGFTVVTGHAYAPKSVAEKVRSRLTKQAVVFVVLTSGSDSTWLTQESILADSADKPLILLKAPDAEFKAALLADHEYIPFEPPNIEAGFIPVLEGLRELGYLRKK